MTGQDSWDRTTEIGQLGQDSWDKSIWTGRPDRSAGSVHPLKDKEKRMARKWQQGQDS